MVLIVHWTSFYNMKSILKTNMIYSNSSLLKKVISNTSEFSYNKNDLLEIDDWWFYE